MSAAQPLRVTPIGAAEIEAARDYFLGLAYAPDRHVEVAGCGDANSGATNGSGRRVTC